MMKFWTCGCWLYCYLSGHGGSHFDDALGIVKACVVLHTGIVLGSSIANWTAILARLRRFGGIVSRST
jgi:hypothetical protein